MPLYVPGKRGFFFYLACLFPWLGGPGRRDAAAFTHVPNDPSGAVFFKGKIFNHFLLIVL